MRFGLLIFLFLWFLTPVRATHIVGGEFQLIRETGYNYQFSLHLYFDDVNGDRGAIEPLAPVFIYEKETNKYVTTYYLPIKSQTPVAYTAVACTNPSLKTSKITYNTTLLLSPDRYNHPGGYYAVWERCCRNNIISNIVRPENAGQVFYMEFPPVTIQNNPFVNSSPELFPPLSDYACLNDLFYYDFGGTDRDGDSLVYEMVTPLNGNTTAAFPVPDQPRPAPYALVNWTSGLSTTYQIPGNPTVTIDRNSGLLTLKPTQLGLFVFGVRCSEYRNKVKIGEVRRDFQLMVLDCPKNDAPRLQVRQAGQQSMYREGEVLQIKGQDNRCLDLFITDTEANSALTIEARPINFQMPDQIFNLKSGLVNRNGVKDTLTARGCLPSCLDSGGKTYLMDLIVSDNGCSLPKKDTVRVSFQVAAVPDQDPTLSTTASGPVLSPKFNETLSFDVLGLDPDNDLVSLEVSGQDFNVAGQSIGFPVNNGLGRSSGHFFWKIDCQALSQPSYTLVFKATTISCGQTVVKTIPVKVRPQHQDLPPAITTTSPDLVLRPKLGEKIGFDVIGTDENLDKVSLRLTGVDFDASKHSLSFPEATGIGRASSQFSWTMDCNAVSQQALYTLRFEVISLVCGQEVSRSTTIEVRPDYHNAAPVMRSAMDGKTIELELGTTFIDTVFGSDVDLHQLVLTAKGEGFELSQQDMSFQATSGPGKAQGLFTFNPACQVNTSGKNQYTVHFTLTEAACKATPPQTMTVNFRVQQQSKAPFVPADIITPNNDGLNDYFTLPTLPPDFCNSIFTAIKIYNRWGGQVFESRDRHFKWHASNITDGVYYYHIFYTDKQFKGMVTVVR